MILEFIFRWSHAIFGITWIGMLYYFNFVQTEYFKEAEAEALKDAKAKLAPRALWWFRWGAMFTFLTGLVLLWSIGALFDLAGRPVIWIGSIAGIIMFLNVWLIIWPNQQIVLGLNGKTGDAAAAAGKAGLASRTNTLLSGPMLFGMLGSHSLYIADISMLGVAVCLLTILAIEANALFGKLGPIASVKGVIHCSVALVGGIWLALALL
ncbi:MAG: urate hydroxylase PuuD [Pseudomonadota bacterium]